jgi:hypothetical protein
MNIKNYLCYNDHQTRKEYYERFIFPKTPSFFLKIAECRNSQLLTDSSISFRGLEFGCPSKKVLEKFGEPRYILKDHGISSLIFFYKELIFNNPILTQLHFIEDQFFSATYTFRHHKRNQILFIKQMLFDKHESDLPPAAVNYNRIIGKGKNSINVIDNVNLNILYLWGNEKIKSIASDISSSNYLYNKINQDNGQIEMLMGG